MNKLVLLNLIFNFLSRILSGNNRVLLFVQLKLKKSALLHQESTKRAILVRDCVIKKWTIFRRKNRKGIFVFHPKPHLTGRYLNTVKRHDTIIRHCSLPPPLFLPFTAKLKWWPKGKSDCKFFRIFLCSLRSRRFRASSSRKLAD